jgi:hypothetical protein
VRHSTARRLPIMSRGNPMPLSTDLSRSPPCSHSTVITNVMVEWLALLLRIQEIQVSNLGPNTSILTVDFRSL